MSREGINVYIVSKGGAAKIPLDAMQRCLLIEIDEQNRPVRVTRHDIFGEVNFNPSSIQMQELIQMAVDKKVVMDGNGAHLLHVSSQELEKILPFKNVPIHSDKRVVELVKHYFLMHPKNSKLSRKISGLSHSYIQNKQGEIIQLANKDECRVAWLNMPPTQDVFLNFPYNTSSAYVVVPSTTGTTYTLYYIKKGSADPAEEIDTLDDVEFFEPFKLNNRGLSKAELGELEETHEHGHIADDAHILGKGGFGRVKQSRSTSEEELGYPQVTKTQLLSSSSKLQTKMEGRDVEIRALQDEASISEDLSAGSDEVSLTDSKGYIHMENLGEPLANSLSQATQEEKVAWSISTLDEVARIHSGDASKRGQPYAHRDIKLANFVKNPTTGKIRLIDFGLTTTNITNKDEKLGGTLQYAPLDQALINEYLAKGLDRSPKDENDHTDGSDDESVDDDSVYDFLESEESEQELPSFNPSAPVHIEAGNRDLNWNFHMRPNGSCLTENYLEDDKVAELRTIYCNPKPANPKQVLSIFDTESFEKLPKPIQRILDTTTIAPLLTKERRPETCEFFEAVLIFYQANPNLSDREYEKNIVNIRQSHALQESLIQQYREVERANSPSDSEMSGIIVN